MTRVLATAVLVALMPAAAWAGKSLEDAQAAFDALDIDAAEPLYEKALMEPGTRQERIRAWKGLGLSLAFKADAKGAQDAFERMLLIEPDEKVDAALGPRITKPYEAAKKSMKGKRATFKVERAKSGDVTVELTDALGLTSEVRLFWRVRGNKAYQLVKVAGADARAVTPSDKEVDAYAQALDPQGGVLFEEGTEAAPKSLPAVTRTEQKPPDAVVSAVKDANKKSGRRPAEEPPVEVSAEEDDGAAGGSNLPLYLGAAVAVIGGGVAVGYLVSRPPEVQLAPADRTAQLPWRF